MKEVLKMADDCNSWPRGELYLFLKSFFLIIYKCCKHLLTISKVLETLGHPFQSYGAFCPCTFTYLHSKLEETPYHGLMGKEFFFGVIKWPPFIPGSSSATERNPNFMLSHFQRLAQRPSIYKSSAHAALPLHTSLNFH